ncbi:MAG: metallophosphoesterase, partial [Syntrophothermus sp.]
MKKLVLFILFITIQLQAQNTAFRFAWLTDTHVGSSTGEEDLRLSVADINENLDVDFTIISGDITESGKTSDLKIAKDILDKLNKPYYIIPGNHDTKWSESGAAAFPVLWGKDRFVFRFRDFLFLGMHEGPVLRMADGHFSPEDLRWLDSEIGKYKGTSQKVIFVTHYPLDDQIDNWYEVIRRLREINIQMVLVGHGHANRIQNYEGIHGIMGRSNLRAGKQTGGFNIVEIRNDSAFFSERTPKTETKGIWASLAFSEKYDPVDTVKHLVPDFSINEKYPSVREKWKFDTGYLITASPVVSGNIVITGNSNGDIYGLDIITGKTLWKYFAGSPVYSPLASEDNCVVAAAANGTICCLNS